MGTKQWGGRRAQQLTTLCLDTWGTVCHLCGQPGADTADHLLPRSHGGDDSLDNLRPAHHRCNSSRGNRPIPAATPTLDAIAFFGIDLPETPAQPSFSSPESGSNSDHSPYSTREKST